VGRMSRLGRITHLLVLPGKSEAMLAFVKRAFSPFRGVGPGISASWEGTTKMSNRLRF
jgi:hypothetical protein